jgi:hypothetical protein
MVKSENAERGKIYFVKTLKGWITSTKGWHRLGYKVVKEFADTDTGVIMADTEHGIRIDLPAGIELEEKAWRSDGDTQQA